MDLTCPRCGHRYYVDVTLSNVTIRNAGMNIVVPCPACEFEWDATGGGDGTWSTVGRRLVKVADHIGEASVSELAEWTARIAQIRAAEDERAALEELVAKGWTPPDGKTRREAARQALQDLELLGRVVVLYVGGGLGGAAAAAEIIRRLT